MPPSAGPVHGVQAIENAAPATIGPPLPARASSASTCHSRLSRSMNVAAMNSTPMTISSTAPMFGEQVLVVAQALAERGRGQPEEDEDGRERGDEQQARDRAPGASRSSSISSTRTPVIDREVAGHQRQHAGREERDQPGDEGDRDVGSVDWVHGSFLPGGCARGSVQRRREAAPVLAGELVVGAELGEDRRPSPRGSGRAARGRSARRSAPAAARAPPRSRPRPRRRRRSPAADRARRRRLPARAAPGPRGPRRRKSPRSGSSSSSASPVSPRASRILPEPGGGGAVARIESRVPCAATPRRRPRRARRRATARVRRASARSAPAGSRR